MGRVVVVTDDSTCLPPALAAELSIAVLPISSEAELLASADANGGLPESFEPAELSAANHPFVTEYLAAIEAPGVDAAVLITPAVEFAAMFRNAALATELADRPAVAIDARTAAAGQALVVLAGAEAAQRGEDLAAVVRASERAARRVELVASLESLERIRRSGPLAEEVLPLEEQAGARSIFRMRAGTVEPLGGAATAEESLLAIRDAYLASARFGVERTTVFHAGAPALAERLSELLGGVDFVTGFSLAMEVHTGHGVVGAAWVARDDGQEPARV